MADFCHQCSMTLFGKDFGDFAGLCRKGHLALVLCEDCGPIQVDCEGNCVSPDCTNHGRKAAPDERDACPACGADPMQYEVRNHDPAHHDGDVHCLDCGARLRAYNAG